MSLPRSMSLPVVHWMFKPNLRYHRLRQPRTMSILAADINRLVYCSCRFPLALNWMKCAICGRGRSTSSLTCILAGCYCSLSSRPTRPAKSAVSIDRFTSHWHFTNIRKPRFPFEVVRSPKLLNGVSDPLRLTVG